MLRARHEFGVLMLDVEPALISASRVHEAYDACLYALDPHRDHPQFHLAIGTVWRACTLLMDEDLQALLRTEWCCDGTSRTPSKARPITRTLTCPIDVHALTAFAASPDGLRRPINKKGEPYGGNYAFIIHRLLGHVAPPDHHGVGLLSISYWHSALGATLINAGLFVASREYAIGTAPIKWPKRVRALALARFGAESDDSKCHPRALAAVVVPVAELCGFFIRHNKAIVAHLANVAICPCNPHLPPAEATALLKPLFNALHMDGAVTCVYM